MRIMTLALAAVLAVGLSVSASAAKRTAAPTVASFEKCEQLAIDRGAARADRPFRIRGAMHGQAPARS